VNNIDQLAEQLFERLEKRRIESGRRGRSETGTGHPEVGKVLTGYREYWGMTKRSLAKAADLNHTFIGRIENGERGIKIESLCKLRRVLGDEFALEYLDAYDEFVSGYTTGPGPTEFAGESPVQEQPRSPHSGATSHDAPGRQREGEDGGEDVGTFQVHQVSSGPGLHIPNGQ
jgi:transcriptional regulator with XRE-family HTH domain